MSRFSRWRDSVFAMVVLCAFTTIADSFAAAQFVPASAPAANQPAVPEMVIQPTATDLATAWLRLDRWMTAHPPDAALLANVSRTFDHATAMRFSHANPAALHDTNDAFIAAQNDPASAQVQGVALAIRVRMTPPVLAIDHPQPLAAELRSMYRAQGATEAAVPYTLRIVGADGLAVVEQMFILTPGPSGVLLQSVPVDLAGKALKPSSYNVELQPPAGPPVFAARWFVVPRALSSIRSENAQKLDDLKPDPALTKAVAAVRARNALLTDYPSADSTLYLTLDLPTFASEVSGDVESLRAGRDPFIRRLGDTWRTLTLGSYEHRFRVFAPPAACTETPGPLVIALNLIGGDENNFFDLYGDGELKKLAEKNGFVVVAANLTTFGIGTEYLPGLIDEIARCYAIDPQRIYLIGHDRGANVVNKYAIDMPDRFAGVCMISGGGAFIGRNTLAKSLVVMGEADTLIEARTLKDVCRDAAKAGLPIEYRSYPNCGHTMVVRAALPDIIAWMLERRAGPATQGAQH